MQGRQVCLSAQNDSGHRDKWGLRRDTCPPLCPVGPRQRHLPTFVPSGSSAGTPAHFCTHGLKHLENVAGFWSGCGDYMTLGRPCPISPCPITKWTLLSSTQAYFLGPLLGIPVCRQPKEAFLPYWAFDVRVLQPWAMEAIAYLW